MPYDPERHGPQRIVGPGFHEQVFEVVEQVPAGSVTTYGDVGAELGSKGVARQVGYALAAMPEDRAVPWHRVVNAHGEVSERAGGDRAVVQRKLLEREGVRFDERGRIQKFKDHRWQF